MVSAKINNNGIKIAPERIIAENKYNLAIKPDVIGNPASPKMQSANESAKIGLEYAKPLNSKIFVE